MNIERAVAGDAGTLTTIALAAKSHWGYPESWIRHWSDVLTITADYIGKHPTFVANVDRQKVGFCAIQLHGGDAVLDHLWVLPSAMRRGVGRALFQQAEESARAHGAVRLTITGDPHAEAFYCRMGATVYGREPAHMDGQERHLPLLAKAL